MTQTQAPTTTVSVAGQTIAWRAGETLFAALMGAGLPVASACSGQGACGLCVVHLEGAPLALPTAREVAFIAANQLQRGVRLACCLRQPQPYRVRLGALAPPP